MMIVQSFNRAVASITARTVFILLNHTAMRNPSPLGSTEVLKSR
jgi:hypothetical protein